VFETILDTTTGAPTVKHRRTELVTHQRARTPALTCNDAAESFDMLPNFAAGATFLCHAQQRRSASDHGHEPHMLNIDAASNLLTVTESGATFPRKRFQDEIRRNDAYCTLST